MPMIQRRSAPPANSSPAFYQLLVRVVQVADENIDSAALSAVLADIRDHFGFDSAFVYEHEPSGRLTLQESASTSGRTNPPESFTLDSVFTADQAAQLVDFPVLYTDAPGSAETDTTCRMRELFASKSMFVVFISDDVQAIVACVGMADTRRHEPPEDDELDQANMLFKPLAERARLRVYKRKLGYAVTTLESIMDHIGFDIYVNDFDTHEMLYANKSMAKPYGGWENMRGKTCFEALYSGQSDECTYCPKKHLIDEQGNPSKTYSWDYQRPFDGKWFRVISTAFTWMDGRLAHVISSTDIDEAKNNELLIKRMAYCDMLTGMPNRRKFEEDMQSALARVQADGEGIAIMFMDLDGFKQVNDVYGHNGGDYLLKHVADMFLENALTADRCYRYGGDEFIFLFENTSPTRACEYREAILGTLGRPFVLNDKEIACKGSVGIAHYPEDGTSYWQLLDKADEAMYRDKEQRKQSR